MSIGGFKQVFAIVIVAHNLEQARRCADSIDFLYPGQLIEAGLTNQMFDAPRHTATQHYIAGNMAE